MSTPRDPRASQPAAGTDRADLATDALLEYLTATALSPSPDLVARIQVRVAQEPDRTPVRRFLLALVQLRLARAWGAFRQLNAVVMGRGTFPTLIRAQALGVVLLTILTVGALGAGGVVAVQRLVDGRTVTPSPRPSFRVTTVEPIETPRETLAASPTDGPPPTVRTVQTTPRPSPERTPRPTQRAAGAPGDGPASTPRPTHGPRVTPGHTPRPTPRPTRSPRPTDTPRPGKTPRPTERPEPTETDDDGDVSDGSEGQGGSRGGDDGARGGAGPDADIAPASRPLVPMLVG